MTDDDNKKFYAGHHDRIFEKRFHSPYPIRHRVHREIYESVLKHVTPGLKVLDAGCGEGTLSILMAQRGATVVGVDYSKANIDAARSYAKDIPSGTTAPIFLVGDGENLPFADESFDLVVSNHVLEHLPNIEMGAREIYRATRRKAVVAIPTCLNPCSWALLGGDTYWRLSKRSLIGVPFGLLRVLFALCTGADGVDEGYGGSKATVHVFRFPWIGRRILQRVGFAIDAVEAQSVCLPYIRMPITVDYRRRPWRSCGFGTVYVSTKI